jgi:hypothetical protein
MRNLKKIYNSFVDTGNISKEILKIISIKIIQNKSLNEMEKAIFFSKTGEINQIIIELSK